jgi:hypothetical protein
MNCKWCGSQIGHLIDDVKLEETVNHPSHYGGDDTYEVIKVLRVHLTRKEFIGAMKFNIVKYTLRAGKKEGSSQEQDHSKSSWYNDYLKNYLKETK